MIFFFNDTATTEIYTLSLHDALPISLGGCLDRAQGAALAEDVAGVVEDVDRPVSALLVAAVAQLGARGVERSMARQHRDRKSTRLNSSHANISYAVFCSKKKNIYHLL